jgi:hypothetical protein
VKGTAQQGNPGASSHPVGEDAAKIAIAKELVRIQQQSHNIATIQFFQAGIWRAVNLVVGLPAAGIAALAGGLALSGSGNAGTVGALALISATLGSFQTVLSAQKREANATRCANSYLEVRNTTRRLVALDLPLLNYEQMRRRLEEVAWRHEEVNRTADPPSAYAVSLGRRRALRSVELQTETPPGIKTERADEKHRWI